MSLSSTDYHLFYEASPEPSMPSTAASDETMAATGNEGVPAQENVATGINDNGSDDDTKLGENSDAETVDGKKDDAAAAENKPGKAMATAMAKGLRINAGGQTGAAGNGPFTPDIYMSIPAAMARAAEVEKRCKAAQDHYNILKARIMLRPLPPGASFPALLEEAKSNLQKVEEELDEANKDVQIAEANEFLESGRKAKPVAKGQGPDQA
ncbi:hypothetical protein F5X68DRAFT_229252 [Plectosphaerella plurivora]|uniref:Uncharacterized protein n=1 Tax=Plectosphaerella plurivora TaxID=936078 RepID=A0A9P8VII5_9PEZI|nr:hypothetical protein F5X68DRAFT_229252 [Plectosphaerella plurivora]